MAGESGLGAQALGLAQGALERKPSSMRSSGRRLGRTLVSFRRFQWMIADMRTEIEAGAGAGGTSRRWLKDAHPAKVGASASKAKALTRARMGEPRWVYKSGASTWGRGGIRGRRMWSECTGNARGPITIYEGTSEVQRMIIARELLGKGEAEIVEGRAFSPAPSRRTEVGAGGKRPVLFF